MGLTERTLRGGGWQFLSVLFQTVLQLAVIAILARHLSPEAFGLVAIASIATNLIMLFSEVGFRPALIQRKELTPLHVRVAFTLTFGLAIFLTTALWLAAPAIADFFNNAAAENVLKGMSLAVPFSVFSTISGALLERELAFKKLLVATMVSYTFGYAAVSVSLAFLGYGVWSIVVASIANSVLSSAMLFILAPHSLVPALRLREIRELFYYSGGVMLARFFNFFAEQGDYFIVGRFLGAGSLGLYERIYRIMNLPMKSLGKVLNKVLFPAMSQIQDDPRRLTRVFLSSTAIINMCLLPLSVLMIILAPEIVILLLGSEWAAAIVPLQILSSVITLRNLIWLSSALAGAVGAVYNKALVRATFAGSVLLGAWLGSFWGLAGVAVGVGLANFSNYILMSSLAISLTKGTCTWTLFLKAHLSGVALAGITTLVALPLAILLRTTTTPLLLILTTTVIAAGLSLLACVLVFPKLIGAYGLWFVERLLESLPWRKRGVWRLIATRVKFGLRGQN